jgi:hypothetical protein
MIFNIHSLTDYIMLVANVDAVLVFWHLVDVGYIAKVVDRGSVYEIVVTHFI